MSLKYCPNCSLVYVANRLNCRICFVDKNPIMLKDLPFLTDGDNGQLWRVYGVKNNFQTIH